MSIDDDTTTLREYFEPITLLPTDTPPPPVSPELVRVLTADIRKATARTMLNTPALAEVLISFGWRPVAPASLLPQWATASDRVCITVACSRCEEPLTNAGEDGGTIHWDTAEAGRQHGEELGWELAGDRLLCEACAAQRRCATVGHDWKHEPVWPSEHGRVELWRCLECETTTRTDPAARARLTVVHGGAR
jgi:hypothetical protein